MLGRTPTGFLLAAAAFLVSFTVPSKATGDGDREAVLQTVQMLLDGWRDADASKLEAVLHAGFREVTLHLQDGKWNFAVEERDRLIRTIVASALQGLTEGRPDGPKPSWRTERSGTRWNYVT